MTTAALSLTMRKPKSQNTVAYGALFIFSFLYFARPEDFVPGLGYLPVEKILGGIAFVALFLGIKGRSRFSRWPRELKLLTAIFVLQLLGILTAFYISGAFTWVFEKCIKCLIVAILVGLVVDSTRQLRHLMFIQASSVAAMTYASILLYTGGRMGGVLGGVFGNPNDLAINIALNFPLCLMFLILNKNPVVKLLWFLGIVMMGRGLMLTYSRSGFLAMAVAVVVSLWEFGVRNKRRYLLVIAGFCVVVLVVVGPQSYGDRIKSIFSNDVAVYGDAKEARIELLISSLVVTAKRPVFGVGAGQFPNYTGNPHVTHNTYTELSSECGIPVLVMFLMVMYQCFRNLSKVRNTARYRSDPEVPLYTSALWAGFASYLAGAFFANTAYALFPYFMVGYTTAMVRISANDEPGAVEEMAPPVSPAARSLPGWMVLPRRAK